MSGMLDHPPFLHTRQDSDTIDTNDTNVTNFIGNPPGVGGLRNVLRSRQKVIASEAVRLLQPAALVRRASPGCRRCRVASCFSVAGLSSQGARKRHLKKLDNKTEEQ
jgi:hypothetical protein